MNYAYIRVSTEMQSYEGQRYEIEQWSRRQGREIGRWVQEKVSGTQKLEKRTLGKLLRRMKPGDTLESTCEIIKSKPPFYFAKGKGYVDGKLCVSAEFSFVIKPAEEAQA